METEIYYFTGTGNSLAAAKTIAEKNGRRFDPHPFPEIPRRHGALAQGAIGVVFPVYYAGPPAAVHDFLGKIEFRGRPYVFAVAHLRRLRRAFLPYFKEDHAGPGIRTLDACFGIHMPQNAFKKPGEKPDKLLARAQKKAEAAAEAVLRQKKGVHNDEPGAGADDEGF